MEIPDKLFDNFTMDEIKVYLFVRYWKEQFGADDALPSRGCVEEYLNMNFERYYDLLCNLFDRQAFELKVNDKSFQTPYPCVKQKILSQSYLKE